jgi:UDP-N-acetylglucosamine:LPS N-acetylglucosamine transferase
MKVCIVSSSGGHLTEAQMLSPVYAHYEHFFILNYKISLTDEMVSRTYFIKHSERDWKFFINLIEAIKILKNERPDVIISTGAGPAVPVSLIGRYLFDCKIIFIETMAAVQKPSLTGWIMYRFSHHFFYQWPSLVKYYPRAQFGGPLI